MSKKTNGVDWAKTPAHIYRRKNALIRLEAQLKSGVKSKMINGISQTVDLTDKDTVRIKKEILILKLRIV